MDKQLIITLNVFLIVALCAAALYSVDSNHEDVPFRSLGDYDTLSNVLGSAMQNDDLIVTIETTEPATVKPDNIHHSVLFDDGISTVIIYNYTGQVFHIAAGKSSGIHLFGVDDKKEYDKINKTVTIVNDTSKKPKMTIKLISSEPDLTTFTEIFEVTNFEMHTPDPALDCKARTAVHKGGNGISKTEWFIGVNQSYVVNITDYKTVQVEKEVYNNKTGKNETVFINETIVSGYHDETRYQNVWSDYNRYGEKLAKNTVQMIKVVYHKKPELGDVRIQTIPMFAGIECDELTWWNTSWLKRVEKTINNASVELVDYQLMNTTSYDSDMNATFSDLRFTNESGTAIPYWIESKTDGVTADVWLKIPLISTTEGAKVWTYYDNPNAASVGDGEEVFEWFDDFEDANYTDKFQKTHGTLTETAGYLQYLPIDGYFTGATAVHSIGAGDSWKVRAKIQKTNADAQNVAFGQVGSDYASSYNTKKIAIKGVGAYLNLVTYDTSQSNSAFSPTVPGISLFTNPLIYEIKKVPGSATAIVSNESGVVLGSVTSTTQIPNSVHGIGVYGATPAGQYHQLFWMFIGKTTATEPTWGADGAEESVSLQDLSITAYAPATPITLELDTPQTFNVSTNITSSCKWYINGSLKQTNSTGATEHAYTNTTLEVGYFNFTACTYTSTESASQTWWVTVNPKYKPPEPVNLTNTTGNFWVNHTWEAGTGNVTDAWNVSVNGVWYNRTYAWYNETYSAHAWQNISVWAWNESGFGKMSD